MPNLSVEIVNPNRSHFITLDWEAGESAKGISREEFHPTLAIVAPRVGMVSCVFSADRYLCSVWSEDGSQKIGNMLSDWRIYLRSTDPSHGVGEKIRRDLADAGEPIIREWIASGAYRDSARNALVYACKREISQNFPYGLDAAEKAIDRHRRAIGAADVRRLSRGIAAFRRGLDFVNGKEG